MKCKIVYLRPRSGFRTQLQSDSLFNALCWAIRMVYGRDKLNTILNDYALAGKEAFYISSAFPYKQIDYCQKNTGPGKQQLLLPYFPAPLRLIEPEPINETMNAEDRLRQYRRRKQSRKADLIPKHEFEQRLGVDNGPTPTNAVYRNAPSIKTHLITHNRISRISGSTLKLDEGGQLFHSPDRQVSFNSIAASQRSFKLVDGSGEKAEILSEEAGLYFLVKGNFEVLKTPLRLLQHLGIGGDRNIGKGSFHIHWQDFELTEASPDKANAVCNLALYRPAEEHLLAIQQGEEGKALYELTTRGGIRGGFGQRYQNKPKLDLIKEGAVLPMLADVDHYGKNVEVGKDHREGHSIYHYGYGFMVRMYVPDLPKTQSQ